MNVAVSALAVASFTLIAGLPAIAQNSEPYPLLTEDAWNHRFYSEWVQSRPNKIDYVVCNKTAATSDFFWPYAAFGVGSAAGLPANHCVQKTDYLTRIIEDGNDFTNIAAKVEVIKNTAEMPTVIWCEFGVGDSCDESVIGGIISWTSSMRAFAEGANAETAPPFLYGHAQLEAGRYEIEIRRDDRGELLIVAVSPSSEGLQLQTPGVESTSGVLGDLFPLPEGGLSQGLLPGMSAVLVPAAANPDVGMRVIFTNQTQTPVGLAIIALTGEEPAARMDTVPLLAPLQ